VAGASEPQWLDYVRKAFTWRWNLLALGGGLGVALLSGVPDVAVPLVLAAELAYLGGLTAMPKFRAAVAAEAHAASRAKLGQGQAPAPAPAQTSQARLDAVLAALDPERRARFLTLRDRCLAMKRIAAGVRGEQDASAGDSLHTAALERMLWVFVRLLSAEQALGRFIESTDDVAMQARVGELEAKIADPKLRDDEKILRALVDSLATAQLRLDNFQKAARNTEFVKIELDRIEGKIQALVEMAVSHEDPDFISSQVDSVAESISHTEQAMREMTLISSAGSELEEAAPSLLAEGQL
jgi:DNA-binding FrmR family transcriptional regulator